MNQRHDDSTPFDAIIIGGGLSGLTAACYLGRAGHKVAVLERAPDLGGRGRTTVRDGYHLNMGLHALYASGLATPILKDLGVPILAGVPDGEGLALLDGAAHLFPASPMSAMRTGLLSAMEKIETARVLRRITRAEPGAQAGRTAANWLDANVDSPNVRKLIEGLFTLTTYVTSFDQVSADLPLGSVQAALSGGVWYLHEGWQQLTDGLADRAREAGATIRTGAAVTGVESDDGGAFTVTLKQGAPVEARAVLLAVPPRVAARLCPESDTARRWADDLRPIRAACLDLALDGLHDPRLRFALGLDQPTYYSVHSAYARLAPEGAALVHLAWYKDLDDDTPAATHRSALESVMDRLQPGWRDHLVHARYLPDMMVSGGAPLAHRGGMAGRPDIDGLGVDGLAVAGDWVGPDGHLADAALHSARRAAEHLAVHLTRTQTQTPDAFRAAG